MSQLPLPFGHPVAAAAGPVDIPRPVQPPPMPADPVRVGRYRALCTLTGRDPAVLVRAVTDGRTTDPGQLTADELEALARAWSQTHPADGPSPAEAPCEQERAQRHLPRPAREQERAPHKSASRGQERAPQERGVREERRADANSDARDGSGADARTVTRMSGARRPDTGAPRADGDERYVVAIAPHLLAALRLRAARDNEQMRVLVARAVTRLLDDVAAGAPAPPPPEHWRVRSEEHTRLAMRWPAGLADRLRKHAAATSRPAYELVAAAIDPLVPAPKQRRPR